MYFIYWLKGKKGVNSQEEMILYQLREESDLLLKQSSISWGKGMKNIFYQKLMLSVKLNAPCRPLLKYLLWSLCYSCFYCFLKTFYINANNDVEAATWCKLSVIRNFEEDFNFILINTMHFELIYLTYQMNWNLWRATRDGQEEHRLLH